MTSLARARPSGRLVGRGLRCLGWLHDGAARWASSLQSDARCLLRVEATLAPYGDKWLGQGPADVIESAWPGSVVLVQFPSREAATAWYNSPDYQEIIALRTDNAISDLVLVDAVAPDFTSRAWVQGMRGSAAT